MILFSVSCAFGQQYGRLLVCATAPGNFDYSQTEMFLNGKSLGRMAANGTLIPTERMKGNLQLIHPLCDTLNTTIALKKNQSLMFELKIRKEEVTRLSLELQAMMLAQCGEVVPQDSLDKPAEFIGNIKQFLAEELRYPQYEVENEKGGKVYTSFIVTETGELACITIEMGVSPAINKETLRVLQKAPRFKPATKNGMNVKSKFNLPVQFKLQ